MTSFWSKRQEEDCQSLGHSKIAFVSSLLADRAAAWVFAFPSPHPMSNLDFQAFSLEMSKVFEWEGSYEPAFVPQTTIPLTEPREVSAIDGNFLVKFTHKTSHVALTLSGTHHESLQLHVISSPLSPWLKQHNPNIDWSSASISDWSNFCHDHRLRSAVPVSPPTSSELPEETDLDNVPSEYHDFKLVFRKAGSKDRKQLQRFLCSENF